MDSCRNKIVNALIGVTNAKFCVEETLTPGKIEVTVKKVGKLAFPLSKAYILTLFNISRTVKFSMGEETMLDKNVCNVQIIDSRDLNVTIDQRSLLRITSNVQKVLGLPADSTLTPHLHNMLIYGPGQFYNQHRNSERLANMVATLVIILPSPHIGGDLIIAHGKDRHIFSSENIDEENVKCICFYSDCLHNVNKVKRGYRVALTFNVVLETGQLPDTAFTNKKLKAAVRDYFNKTAVNLRPKKMVFFLNHIYLKDNLLWYLLKGEDRGYAFSFRSVARELDLDAHLVLADIHQNWSSTRDYTADSNEFFEIYTTLSNWVDANNLELPYDEYPIMQNEVCFSQETGYANFDSTKEHLSGLTGNAVTVHYRYKRAAVVLWRKSDLLMIKFELSYDEAMAELRTLISVPGNEKKVFEILNKAAKLSQRDRPTRDDFETFVNCALYVKTKEEAQTTLSRFRLDVLIAKNAKMLTKLQQKYGVGWLIELFDVLRRRKRYGYLFYLSSYMDTEAINPFVREFLNSGGDQSVMECLLDAEVTTFISSEYSTSNLHRELFKACQAIENVTLQEKLAQYLSFHPKLFPKNKLIQLYHQLQKTLSPEISEFFRTCLKKGIKQELSQIRGVCDWSLCEFVFCICQHCYILNDFLRSSTKTRKVWPANETIRRHVMSILKRSEAPVSVTIEYKGSPYSMVLVKSPTLHTDVARKCTELKAMLQALAPKRTAKKRPSLMKRDIEKRQKL